MSDLRLVVAALVLLVGPLEGQERYRDIEARIAQLEQRQARLAAAVARRDSAALRTQHLTVLGSSPLQVAVPEWVAAAVTAQVQAREAVWHRRFGALFDRLPAETITVQFPLDTAGWSKRTLAFTRQTFPDRVAGWAEMGASARVMRALPAGIREWLGAGDRLEPFARSRRAAIVALARSGSGIGDRCLLGEIASCRVALEREPVCGRAPRRCYDAPEPSPRIPEIRSSLVAFATERGGAEGWLRLADAPAGRPIEQVAFAARLPADRMIAAWVEALRRPTASESSVPLPTIALALLWGLGLVSLFMWRLSWLRA